LNLGDLANAPEDEYTLVGTVANLRPIQDKNGKSMAFGSLQDYRGEIDLVFFGKAWENCQGKITGGKPAALKGRLDKSREKPSFKVSSVLDLERLEKKTEKMAEARAENGDTEQSPRDVPDRAAMDRETGSGQASPYQAAPGEAAPGKAAPGKATIGGAAGGIAGVGGSISTGTAGGGVQPWAPPTPSPGQAALYQAPPGGASDKAALRAAPEEQRWRELHIRLDSRAARLDEDLLPLRDELMENPGPCQVFIHVPEPGRRETVIRTASQISADAGKASLDALRRCPVVAEVWGE
jgi:DNA polymerase-3 subunit alpha